MKLDNRIAWIIFGLAVCLLLLIAAFSAHAENGVISVHPLGDGSCVITGDGIQNAIIRNVCTDDYSFNYDRTVLVNNQTLLEPFNCNYSVMQEFLNNFSAQNFSNNFSLACNDSAGLERQNLIESELKSFIDERVVNRLNTLTELQAVNQNLSQQVTDWKSNATGSWGSLNSLQRENENLYSIQEKLIWACGILLAACAILSSTWIQTKLGLRRG